jgi:hypothetical protein
MHDAHSGMKVRSTQLSCRIKYLHCAVSGCGLADAAPSWSDQSDDEGAASARAQPETAQCRYLMRWLQARVWWGEGESSEPPLQMQLLGHNQNQHNGDTTPGCLARDASPTVARHACSRCPDFCVMGPKYA